MEFHGNMSMESLRPVKKAKGGLWLQCVRVQLPNT